MVCPACGRENADHYKFCLSCGATLVKPDPASRHPDDAQDAVQTLLAEADDFMRFGLFADAERALKGALAQQPKNQRIRQKLFELMALREG